MKTIAVNALNSNSGGGKSIRDSFLKLLNEQELSERYVVIATKDVGLNFITNPNIEILELRNLWRLGVLAPLSYRYVLKQILQRIGADIVFNMGDLIIRTNIKQIYIFDWPYALDVHPKVWKDMNFIDRLNRRVKFFLLKRNFSRPDIVIAQTDHIKGRLKDLYNLQDVRVINNAVTINPVTDDRPFDFSLPIGTRLVYPTVYYPHKNLEILLDLGELIVNRGLDYKIITTINPDTEASRNFLDSISKRGLSDAITNLGQIPLNQMHSLYKKCDGLLMPTLLESFSIVYLESMYYDLPVFTSDMWFAHAVCDSAAKYFDPLNAEDILCAIEEVMPNEAAKKSLIEAGSRQLLSFPDWRENFATYQKFIAELTGT